MDDNIQKSKTALLLSVSYCVRMLGPALGYALASFSLKQFIAPSLTPVIDTNDQRWLGAWWFGWIVLSSLMLIFGIILSCFPRELPRAQLRRLISCEEKRLAELSDNEKFNQNHGVLKNDKQNISTVKSSKVGKKDMFATFKRVLTNKILMLNTTASVFYYFGFLPYWIFTPKYIEMQFRQSASTSRYIEFNLFILTQILKP